MALGVVTVTCTPGVTFSVGMAAGQHWDGSMRNMANGLENVPYILWADSAGTLPWGDAGLTLIEPAYAETHPAPAQNSNGTGSPQNFFVWGDALISGKPAGTYTDTVSITVVWP
jgi:spore coat protein U-like protein